MRSLIFALALLSPAGILHAQGDLLLQNLELLDPTLTATVAMSQEAGDCQASGIETWSVPPAHLACVTFGTSLGGVVSADGALLKWYDDSLPSDPACPVTPSEQRNAVRVIATAPDKTSREVIRIYTRKPLACDAGGLTRVLSSDAKIVFDVTNGVMQIARDVTIAEFQMTQGWVTVAHDKGVVSIGGFPKLFDTLLTFLPGGQSLSIVTPAHPDGFRSADSLQVWTGNVRTLPDWSQARPLACSAATSPTPGQVVTISDTLPDPPVGQGLYYLTASVDGPDRRLGRQFVNGAFSARDPATLPVCQ